MNRIITEFVAFALTASMLTSVYADNIFSRGETVNFPDEPVTFSAKEVSETNAMVIGDYEVSVSEYLLNYLTAYNSYMTYNESAKNEIDPLKPFDEQKSFIKGDFVQGFTATAHDVFSNAAIEMLTQTAAFLPQAKADGLELNSEYRKKINDYLQAVSDAAKKEDKTMQTYIESMYGPAMTEVKIREYLGNYYLAQQWREKKLADAQQAVYTDAEYQKYLKEHKSELQTVTYRKYTLRADYYNKNGETREQAMKAAEKKAAEAVKNIKNEADFIRYTREISKEETGELIDGGYTLKHGLISEHGEALKWLSSKSRKINDVKYFVEDDGVSIYIMLKPMAVDDDRRVSIRMFTMKVPGKDDFDKATTAEKFEVIQKTQALYIKWRSGAATEESFIKLVKEKSEDEQTRENGGLLSDISNTGFDFVKPITDWCFAPIRKPGDSVVLTTSFGCHILYFVDGGMPNWSEEARKYFIEKNTTQLFNELIRECRVVQNDYGMEMARMILRTVDRTIDE